MAGVLEQALRIRRLQGAPPAATMEIVRRALIPCCRLSTTLWHCLSGFGDPCPAESSVTPPPSYLCLPLNQDTKASQSLTGLWACLSQGRQARYRCCMAVVSARRQALACTRQEEMQRCTTVPACPSTPQLKATGTASSRRAQACSTHGSGNPTSPARQPRAPTFHSSQWRSTKRLSRWLSVALSSAEAPRSGGLPSRLPHSPSRPTPLSFSLQGMQDCH